MVSIKKTFLMLVLVVVLTLLPQLTQAYESYNEAITGGNIPIPIIEEQIVQISIQAGGLDSGEYGHLEFRDEYGSQIFEVWNHNYISRVYNSAGGEVCSGRTDGSPDPTNINFVMVRNPDGTYNITFSSENPTPVTCNNINVVTGSGKLIKSLSAPTSGLSFYNMQIATTQNEGLWVRGIDGTASTELSSYNTSLNESPNRIQYNTLSYFNMTGKSANNYTLTTSKENYTTNYYNFSWDGSNSEFYDAYIYGIPSINLTYYDVLTNSQLTDVFTIFDGESNYFTQNITTGNYYSLVDADYYRIIPQKTDYVENSFYINLTPETAGVINAYLVKTADANEITLTVQDGSLIAVPDALVSVYFRNGTNLKLVGTGRTSIIGKTSFTLNPDYTHTFIIEASGYNTKTFNYLPTESLTVTLSDTEVIEYETVLDTINYAYSPTTSYVIAGDSQDFTFTVSDSNSQLSSFCISYQDGAYCDTGSPSGSILTININTSNYTNERLLFNYNLTTISGEFYDDSHNYFVMGTDAGNTTGFYAFQNFSYTGKALTLLAVLLIGMALLTLAKMGFGSSLITLSGTFLLVLFTWLGWVNAWLGYSTAILVFLLTIFRGGIFE